MFKLIQTINKNILCKEIFEEMDRTITAKGEYWLVFSNYILNKRQIVKICNERIFDMIKLLPNSINFERKYLNEELQYFKNVKKIANVSNF